MSAKKRKPLDDAVTRKFVDDQKEKPDSEQIKTQDETKPESEQESVPVEAPAAKSTSTPQPAKFNLMSRLQRITPKEPTVRLTVDLTESMHRNLSVLAAKTGRKKAEIIRLLLDEALKDLEY